MDFAVWSILMMNVLTYSQPKMDLLKAVIQSAWTKLNEEAVRRSCASVKAGLRHMIKAKGDVFEIWPVYYVFNEVLKSCVKDFFHLTSDVIFIRVFDV